MKINENQINYYVANYFTFKKRSKPFMVNGQNVAVETYERRYRCKDKPKLIYTAIRDTFKAPFSSSTSWPETLEKWRAFFTGKKIAKAQISIPARVLVQEPLEDLVDDEEVRKFCEYASKGAKDGLTSEEIDLLTNVDALEFGDLNNFLNRGIKEILQNSVIDKTLTNHKGNEFNIKLNKLGTCRLEINIEEGKDSVFLDGTEYHIPLDLLQKIIQGYVANQLEETYKEDSYARENFKNYIDDLNIQAKDLVRVKLKEF